MPSQSLLQFTESPDGLTQDSLINNSASVPEPGSSMTPHDFYPDNSGRSILLSCMFCEQTFAHQDELGPHVLTQHPTTFFEPAVLKVEAEFRIPGERPRPKQSSLADETAEVHSCIVCGHVSQDAGELETHLRKHKDYFTYCCHVCGRRFREPWFLKNHMKMHVKSGVKGKAQQDPDTPATINDVVQEPASESVVTAFKMCMVCGFFFPDQESLAEHSRVHNREAEPVNDEDTRESPECQTQQTFLHTLNLVPCTKGKREQPERLSKWIPQLDPYNTYQAWQLATKGKVAVGPGTAKDITQEASTDNSDSGSDKEELNNIFSGGQGDKANGRELRSQQQAGSRNPESRRSLIQKNKDTNRPTTCEECQRTFRTYHQLVLHSRVHKRDRAGDDSPTSSVDGKLSRASSVDQTEEVNEDGLEDTAMAENFAGEDGLDRSKIRSKECGYCGKSFRSSYYLTVHLRTHTGEKPYKCAYCEYAAAQKTSLKYHLDRRHKDKPYVEIPVRSESLTPSPTNVKHENENQTPTRAKLWVPETMLRSRETQEIQLEGKGGEAEEPLVQPKEERDKPDAQPSPSPIDSELMKCPVPINLKVETEIKEEPCLEAPLNLSLKVSLSIRAAAEHRNALVPTTCPFCAYKSFYPEVLIMHKRLTHKDKSDSNRRSVYGGSSKPKRFTGCPPALDGKDVAPLPLIERRHPRRTKSPSPQPARTQERTAVKPYPGPKPTPRVTALEQKRPRPSVDSHAGPEPPRYMDFVRKSNPGKFGTDRPTLIDRVGIGETCYPARADVIWPSDAARLCLSSRFGSLPRMDFGEPSSKRLKYTMSTGREADVGEKLPLRGPAPDVSSRLMISGRSLKPSSSISEALGSVKNPAIGGGLDAEWGVMNLLRSCSPNNLASLYHGAPTNPGHSGPANPRAGGRTILYQHRPILPGLPRRDHPGPFPNPRYGPSDKTT